jgi:hypothetical protein
MKKTLLFTIACLLIQTGFTQTMYDNFDDERIITYGFDIPYDQQLGNGIGGTVWPGWHGTLIQYSSNPFPDVVNSSPNCLEYSRNPSETYDVIVVRAGLMEDLASFVDGTSTMSMDIFSPVPGITVQITLEDSNTSSEPYPTGRHSEYTAVTTTGAQWETLTFQMVNQPDLTVADADVEQMVILFNPGNNVSETYYVDNLMGPELVDPPCVEFEADEAVINDLDCNQNAFSIEYADGRLSRFPNPFPVGNDSPTCLEYARNGGAQDDVIVGYFGENLNFANGSTIFMDVYDPNAPSAFVISIQDAFGNELAQATASVLIPNTWETLEFDFSSISSAPNASNFVILYEPGELVPDVVYIDNIRREIEDNVNELDNFSSLDIYPNPSNGLVTIDFGVNTLSSGILTVLNCTGKTVHAQRSLFQGQHQIDLSKLEAGVYLVNYLSETTTAHARLVIQ